MSETTSSSSRSGARKRNRRKPAHKSEETAGSRGRGGRSNRGRKSTGPHDAEADSKPSRGHKQSRGGDRRGKGGGKGPRGKSRYEPYITKEAYEAGVADGSLLTGPLRVVSFPYSSFVLRDGERDIMVQSQPNLNRAFQGDIVAVKLVPARERKRNNKSQDDKKDKKKEENSDDDEEESDEEALDGDDVLSKIVAQLDDDSSEIADEEAKEAEESEPVEKEEEEEKQEERRYGHVVYVVEENRPTELIGTYCSDDRKFHPMNERFPYMSVRGGKSFLQTGGQDEDAYFYRAKIATWNEDQYYPTCDLIGREGAVDNFDTQYAVLKLKNNVDHEETFDESLTADLPLSGWSIPADELARREDLRNDLIFSIDPPTAKDLDDALSCTRLPNGNFEVGVHIADVSFFVKTNSPLDLEARDRATTVYFTEENVPMLPRILCDELCSLKGNVDRLAFSVIWELTESGEKVKERFTRSVINTRGQLDYATAQKMIKEPELFADGELADCAVAVQMMNVIAKNLTAHRFESGSVALDSAELSFTFDEEREVTGVAPYMRYDSHFLVEEFMLLANTSVAEFLTSKMTEGVMLRRHPPLDPKGVKVFLEQCKRLKLDVDVTSSLTLHQSIQRIQQEHSGLTMEAIRFLISKPMQSALYCSTVSDAEAEAYHHYALNYRVYCHFTSPIRRYPDLVTHRQLAAVLDGQQQELQPKVVMEIANNCNQRKRDADYASRDCRRLYLNKFLRTRVFIEKGIIVAISKGGASILVPSYDIYKEIQWNTDEYERQWHESRGEVTLKWKKQDGVPTPKPVTLGLLSMMDVELLHTTEKFCHTIGLRLAHPAERAAFEANKDA